MQRGGAGLGAKLKSPLFKNNGREKVNHAIEKVKRAEEGVKRAEEGVKRAEEVVKRAEENVKILRKEAEDRYQSYLKEDTPTSERIGNSPYVNPPHPKKPSSRSAPKTPSSRSSRRRRHPPPAPFADKNISNPKQKTKTPKTIRSIKSRTPTPYPKKKGIGHYFLKRTKKLLGF